MALRGASETLWTRDQRANRWAKRGVKHAAAWCIIAAVGVAGCGSSSPHACVPVPQPIPSTRLLTSGTKLTVPVGAIVYVVLVEPMAYSVPGFPWRTPASSDQSVVAPVRLCKRTGASSLPLTVTGFRAVGAGKATLSAPLTLRSRALKTKTKPQPALDFVTVS